ncbi:MAG: helix-turn-helix transcriptional regulator [Ruminococcaceae bacterium]|nr:helix-turn-helix transcriptional regulator [Oscillospiraceae bacterium]
MEIGARIRQYRSAAGLSQEVLAQRILVSRQTLSNWENGKTTPDIHSLILLCDEFQITLDELVHTLPSQADPILPSDIRRFRLTRRWMRCALLAFFGFLPLIAFVPQIVAIPVWLGMCAVVMGLLLRLEWLRKRYNIQTRRETNAFLQGVRLMRMDSAMELGKRPYQKSLRCITGILFLGLVTSVIMPPILLLLGA